MHMYVGTYHEKLARKTRCLTATGLHTITTWKHKLFACTVYTRV